jgi:hypothetical protein
MEVPLENLNISLLEERFLEKYAVLVVVYEETNIIIIIRCFSLEVIKLKLSFFLSLSVTYVIIMIIIIVNL